MAKRVADRELTDRNWDQEDELEDAGTFSVASHDILKNREIKKAKRRNFGSEGEKGGAFKGFQGLVSSGTSFTGFGAAKSLQSLTNGNGSNSLLSSPKPAAESKLMFGSLITNGPPAKSSASSLKTDGAASTAKTNGETPSPTSAPSKPCNTGEYSRQLTSLNCSVRDWIVKHVNANPLCDLTPIFRDYEKHLASIEQKYGASSTDSGSESDSTFKSTPTIPTFGSSKTEGKLTFSFSSKPETSESAAQPTGEKKTEPASLFTFGQKSDTANLTFSKGTAATFSFKSGPSNLFNKDVAQSSSGTPSFSFQKETSTKSEDSGGGEEEEEPPKVVIQEVKEDNAFYSKKCKLFYKKDNEFKEKGVGTLHLKPVGDQKTQLLVRADTNLGNILLNILVQPSMPCSRTGKNNVMIVCVPNPAIDEKNPTVPLTMLIRVKTTEDADELHKLIVEKKDA
ncbi:nuclear pore complex protein Nup50 [Hyperolius riggenbachi]|uniref:nuclear pore complex protein Nup50 n=1 Tax=Hyperolius riggenbachi TaxID=752182 RepID=UPI0035A3AE06